MSLSRCPTCGYNKKAGLLTGSHFPVHKCSKCSHLYCYQCNGSNGGRKCPRCEAKTRSTYGTVYLK
jgi:hypothetical protein